MKLNFGGTRENAIFVLKCSQVSLSLSLSSREGRHFRVVRVAMENCDEAKLCFGFVCFFQALISSHSEDATRLPWWV